MVNCTRISNSLDFSFQFKNLKFKDCTTISSQKNAKIFFGQFFDKICHSGALHCKLHWLLLACVKIAQNFLVLHPSFQCTDRHTGLQSCSATTTIMQNTVRKYSAIHQFSDTLEIHRKIVKKSTNIKITVCVEKTNLQCQFYYSTRVLCK